VYLEECNVNRWL